MLIELALALLLSGHPASGGCTNALRAAGVCDVTTESAGSSVVIRGSSGQNRTGTTDDGAREPYGTRTEADQGESDVCTSPLNRCETYEVVMRQEATLTDVASFAPTLAPLAPEPEGIGVVGLPVNVVATAATHTRTGELFDLPVTVRFRPLSFTFDYGDGATRTSSVGGATWARLGVPPFTATDTSHAYRARGVYTVTAGVHYAADVDFGTGWIPVDGVLTVPAGATTVEILEARTALVERTCIEDPDGIGC